LNKKTGQAPEEKRYKSERSGLGLLTKEKIQKRKKRALPAYQKTFFWKKESGPKKTGIYAGSPSLQST
jgi:hypothetical protein